MSEHSGLPNGWASVALSQCASRITDGTHLPPEFVDSGIPFVFVKHIAKGQLTFDQTKFISEETWQTFHERCPIEIGDILYSAVGSYGVAVPVMTDRRFSFQRHIAHIKPYSHLDSHYLAYYLNSPFGLAQAHRVARGVAQKTVTLGDLKQYRVQIAPLNEQRRIVAKIEELFSNLDAGVAALERIRANLKSYRAAVLKAAVEGKLTEAWRAKHPKTEPASKLLERILAERRQQWKEDQLAKFAAAEKEPPKRWQEKYVEPAGPDTSGLPELPKGWRWVSMEQLVTRSEYGTSVKCDYGASGPPVIRIPNIAKGQIDLADLKQATMPLELTTEDALQKGDLLMCRTNGSIALIGKAALVQNDYEPFHTFASYLLRFRFGKRDTLPKWGHLFVTSSHGRRFIEKHAASSAGQHNISLSLIHSMPLPLPPLAEQIQIADEVERCLSITEEAAAQVDTNLKRAARLRQCILKRAFEGKLVPQDPTDEPAHMLLERIRQEHTATNESVAPRSRRGRVSSQQAEGETHGAGS